MATPQTLDFATIVKLFSAEGVYMVAYSWLFGMCKYNDRLSLTILRGRADCMYSTLDIFLWGLVQSYQIDIIIGAHLLRC